MLSLTVSIRKRSFYMVRKSKPLSNCRAILLKSVHQSRYFSTKSTYTVQHIQNVRNYVLRRVL